MGRWKITCLMCESEPFTTSVLTDMQEHAMGDHGVSRDDIRGVNRHTIDDGVEAYEWTVQSTGQSLMRAERITE